MNTKQRTYFLHLLYIVKFVHLKNLFRVDYYNCISKINKMVETDAHWFTMSSRANYSTLAYPITKHTQKLYFASLKNKNNTNI